MSGPTLASMSDARDAEDARLLEAREHARLLATYFEIIRGRASPAAATATTGSPAQSLIVSP